jgi:hypothetical protein
MHDKPTAIVVCVFDVPASDINHLNWYISCEGPHVDLDTLINIEPLFPHFW